MKREKIKDILKYKKPQEEVTVMGWVRTKRGSKKIAFIELNDGSTIKNIQIVATEKLPNFKEEILKLTTGASIKVRGVVVESPGSKQKYEIQAKAIKVFGYADPAKYPIQKKKMSFEALRKIAHLRPKTITFGAVFRIRSTLSFAIHKFFQEKGFFYVHTPIITGSDCEGAGQMFRVTTLDLRNPPKTASGEIDISQDFFGKETNLTVSGQLEAELLAMGLGEVYTFGPTFRAENSNTPRHAAEFWMVEPEMAFYELEDNMALAEEFIKYITKYILENCQDDMEFFNENIEPGLIDRLNSILISNFKRITYTEAIDILESSGKKFEFPVKWGADLQSEHERFITEEYFRCPVIVTDYPREIKAFYMKLNDDNKTVRAMDLLVPKIGEIIGGSERESDYHCLLQRLDEFGLSRKDYWWYLDTRIFGTVPHSGFGLGFERTIMFLTGMTNIRDVIPFPRTPKNAEF